MSTPNDNTNTNPGALVPVAAAGTTVVRADPMVLRRMYMQRMEVAMATVSQDRVHKLTNKPSPPVVVKLVKKNKPGFGGRESFHLFAQFGSMKNVKGEGCVVPPDGKFILVAMDIGRHPDKNVPMLSNFPVSPITKCPVGHVLLRTGDVRIVFTDQTDATEIRPMSTVYLHPLKTTISLAGRLKTAAGGSGAGSGGANAPSSTFRRAGNAPASTWNAKSPSFMRTAAVSGQQQPSPPQQHHEPPTTTTTSATEPSAKVATGGWTPDEQERKLVPGICELIEAMAVADCSAFCGPSVPDGVVEMYKRTLAGATDGATLTREQCICLEYMHPNVIPCELPPKAIEAGMTVKLAFNCVRLMPACAIEYANQDAMDVIALMNKCEADGTPLDTVVDYGMICDPQTPPIIAVSRPEDEAMRVFEQRTVCDLPCKCPTLAAFQYHFEAPQKSDGTPGDSPLISKSKRDGTTGACIPFTVILSSWPADVPYATAQGKMEYMINGNGRAFETLVQSIFGITVIPAWTQLAQTLLLNTKIWYWLSVDHAATARIESNLGTRINPANSRVSFAVNAAIADVPRLCECFGIPITAECADTLIATAVARFGIKEQTDAGGANNNTPVTAARIQRLGPWTCLTERPSMLRVAVAAGCRFYVISSAPFNWRERNIAMTPELGSAMLSPDWSSSMPVVVPGMKTPINANDPLRDREARVLSDRKTVNYVYSVRPDIGADGARAARAMTIFTEGGRYDDFGVPITITPQSRTPSPITTTTAAHSPTSAAASPTTASPTTTSTAAPPTTAATPLPPTVQQDPPTQVQAQPAPVTAGGVAPASKRRRAQPPANERTQTHAHQQNEGDM